jgi:ribonucleoside-diphosphate reductase alpha chain
MLPGRVVETKKYKISTGESTMQVASPSAAASSTAQHKLMTGETGSPLAASTDPTLSQYKVIRRNGAVVAFEPSKIAIAVTKAFLAVNGGQSAASSRVRELTAHLTDVVVNALMKRKPEGGAIHIEEIQDQVELALMRGGAPTCFIAKSARRSAPTRSRKRAAAKSTAHRSTWSITASPGRSTSPA